MNTCQFSTFYIDHYYLGVEVGKVQEIIRYQKMTKIPLSVDVIGGLINLRGQIVTAIDLHKRLLLKDRPKEIEPMNVIVRDGESSFSLLVDQIGDVISVEDDKISQPPENLSGETKELISSVYKLDKQLLLVLDTQKTISINQSVTASGG